jgi:hypothetical protein
MTLIDGNFKADIFFTNLTPYTIHGTHYGWAHRHQESFSADKENPYVSIYSVFERVPR